MGCTICGGELRPNAKLTTCTKCQKHAHDLKRRAKATDARIQANIERVVQAAIANGTCFTGIGILRR